MRKLLVLTLSITSLLLLCRIATAQSTGYDYAMPITIQSSQVSGSSSLTDFPVLISFTDNAIRHTSSGGHMENLQGYDMNFIIQNGSCDRTNLSFQIETYSPSTGKLEAWVKIPSLSASSNTVIYMLYGKTGVSSNPSTEDVWSNNYRAVYHFNGDVTNNGGASYDGTDYNTTSVTSLIGNAREFNSSSDSIVIDSEILSGGDFTISCWFNPQVAPDGNGHTLFDIYGEGSGAGAKYLYGAYTNSWVRWYYEDEDDRDVQIQHNTSLSTSQWYYYTATGGWNQNSHELFLDGSSVSTSGLNIDGYFSPRTNLLLGIRNRDYVNWERFVGYMDEFRVSSVQRSSDWIATEYANMENPSSFISLGSELELDVSTNSAGNWSSSGIWNTGIVPNSSLVEVSINHDVAVNGDYEVTTLSVASASTLTVESTQSLTTCAIANAGNIDVLNSGSIVQKTGSNLNTGSGTYSVTRNTGTLADNTRYQYWGTPVTSANMSSVFSSSNVNDFYHFNDGTQQWQAATSMTPGKGYITTGDANGGTNFSQDITFNGTINNAISALATSASSGGYLLLGNPYPSAISSASFVGDNSGIDGTLYFWNHTSSGTNSDVDYASWNLTGSTISTGGNNEEAPDDYIQSMQGFFVEATSNNPSIVFNNSQRTAGNNTQFFKRSTQEKRQRIWLNLTNDTNDFNQLLIGFMPDATKGKDRLYDGKKFKAHPRVAFYSMLGNEELAIQGLPYVRINETERIPLGMDAWIPGTYTISLDSLDNYPSNYQTWLEDEEQDTLVPLSALPYAFQVDSIGTIQNRFALVIKNEVNQNGGGQGIETPEAPGTSTGIEEAEEDWIKIYAVHQQIRLEASQQIKQYTMYDVSGRIMETKTINSTNTSQRINHNGLYLIEVELENGEKRTQKVVF